MEFRGRDPTWRSWCNTHPYLFGNRQPMVPRLLTSSSHVHSPTVFCPVAASKQGARHLYSDGTWDGEIHCFPFGCTLSVFVVGWLGSPLRPSLSSSSTKTTTQRHLNTSVRKQNSPSPSLFNHLSSMPRDSITFRPYMYQFPGIPMSTSNSKPDFAIKSRLIVKRETGHGACPTVMRSKTPHKQTLEL